MADIAQLWETRTPDGIVIWEQDEVKHLLKSADKRRDGVTVWIAVLAGLRRSGIARLKWSEVTPAYILVTKSKTGVKRQVPLSTTLSKRLEKESHSRARVVSWPEKVNGWQEATRKMTEVYLPRLLSKIHTAYPEKFGWNAFRHTFASRHAQMGLSLDIIAVWLGDSPKVRKEHYARYVSHNTRSGFIRCLIAAYFVKSLDRVIKKQTPTAFFETLPLTLFLVCDDDTPYETASKAPSVVQHRILSRQSLLIHIALGFVSQATDVKRIVDRLPWAAALLATILIWVTFRFEMIAVRSGYYWNEVYFISGMILPVLD